jgi:hypothetical protein
LLPLLPNDRTRYRFSDVSELFLDQARARFAGYPFVDYGLFNLDAALEEQGYTSEGYDLIVSANAVHACVDLRKALERLRALLAPGGVLVLIESTRHHAWFDMTTGLIEGWQHFEDDLRDDNPLIEASSWVEALRAAGFEAANAFPEAGASAEILGQHVVVARVAGDAPGTARAESAHGAESAARAALDASAPAESSPAVEFRRQVAGALPDERAELLRDFVRRHVMQVLKRPADDPPGRSERFQDIGFDSLMAVQLRNQLTRGLGLDKALPATLMFDYPTIDALASRLMEFCEVEPQPLAAPNADTSAASKVSAEAVEAMSDAEVEALLLERLEEE